MATPRRRSRKTLNCITFSSGCRVNALSTLSSNVFRIIDVDAGPAFSSASRILYMSRPSTPAASCLRLPSSSSLRFCALARGLDRELLRHHDDAVVVGHHHVARLDIDAGADHRNVDRAERRLDRALGRDRARPDREAHLVSAFTSRQPASMIEALDAARHQRGRQQFAEHAVGIVGGAADHQMSPFWHCSTATWIIQLSPGCASTVTAGPAICAPAQIGRM